MNDDEFDAITIKPKAVTGLALKILLLLLVFIFPLVVVYLLQGYMTDLWGNPSPTSPFYLVLFGVLVIWFAVGYLIIIPRVRRRIDTRYSTNRESSI
ncbi:MAG: hypothetical protein ACXADC_16185 [Candidatus Thorarchaeota archaeon]|jgi:hypothetical protein